MVKVNYTGISDPERVFRELRVYHARLQALRLQVKPMGTGYQRLSAAADALCKAAAHFTGRPFFYGGSPCGQDGDNDWRAHLPRQH